MFRKSFNIPYNEVWNYPSLIKTIEAISKYCEENEWTYSFIDEDQVEINGAVYKIKRGIESGSRGGYGILCVKIKDTDNL